MLAGVGNIMPLKNVRKYKMNTKFGITPVLKNCYLGLHTV